MKNKKAAALFIAFSLILLANPNFNLFDIFPDAIACFLAMLVIGKYADIVPYLAEAKSGFLKLGLVNLIKLPASMIMMANMGSGTDIAPLFSLIFCALELVFIYQTVSSLFSALFYIGERSEISALITPFSLSRKGVKISPEALRSLTLVFFTVKSLSFFLPDLCLLTFSRDTTTAYLRHIYPTLVIISLSVTLMLGIVWLILSFKYMKAVRRCGSLADAALALADTDRLLDIERVRDLKRKLGGLSILAVASVFSFEFAFADIFGNVSIIPHAVYIILLTVAVFRLFEKSIFRSLAAIIGCVAAVVSVIGQILAIRFYEKFELRDLLDLKDAVAAYGEVKLWAIIECLLTTALLGLMTLLFLRFTRLSTGFNPDSAYNKEAAGSYHKAMTVKSIILFGYSALIFVLKCVNIFLLSNVELIYTDSSDVTSPVIATSPLPWLGTAITLLTVGLVFYSFYFLSSVKEDVKMKLSREGDRL